MKKPHYYFDMPKETYDFIIKKGILRESKKELIINYRSHLKKYGYNRNF